MRLLVTGAGGMLGQAVAEHGLRLGHEVFALARQQLDVLDGAAVEEALAQARPAAVVHCAAWTDVDGAESDPQGARALNGDGAGNVARASARLGIHMVCVSTDYVFDGHGHRPYLEHDVPAPRTVYGSSKLDGERQVLEAQAGHTIARTSWLFGAGGRNFVDTMLALGAEREEVSVVSDQVGCPTWTGHLAPALVELAERRWGGIHHVAGAGWCSWHELAVEVFDQAAMSCRVLPISSEAAARPAPRPPYSVLGSERSDTPRLAHWTEGVRGHLRQRGAADGAAREREGVR
ncbi:MAG TPA: dTDP-4-dehydrorhamnose reductase [Solirubrobacteraceae bacterium]|jgi:dTDP-4-dehydrorhamnose reductase|nr:dTDP-4-dehydrorhamnose reductase [Solirubrobacteraceae bacterium]